MRIKFGKVDANSEFAFVDAAGSFLNSAAGISTPIFAMPTYPDPAMSMNVFVYPTPWLYAGGGIYDGATLDGIPTGRNGPTTFFSDKRSDSWFSIGEAGLTWGGVDSWGAGRLAVGGWHHTADFERFDGGTERGVSGVYVVGEQQLLRGTAGEDHGLFAFARYAWTDENVSAAGQHIGGGLVLKGTFPGRDDDEAGLFVSRLLLSDAPGATFEGDETVVELYYRFNLTPFIHLTPDLQWIGNPSGDSSIKDAVVGALRVEVDF
jgi:porin